MSKVGIVIVNYNGARYQNDCIKSLKEMEYKDFEVIVVDSCSKDDSIKILRDEYTDVHIIECSDNVGIAAGNNIGIKYCLAHGMEYVLLMNNDVVLDEHLLSELMKKATKETVVVPKIYFYEPCDLLWYAGGKLVWNRGTAVHIGMRNYDNAELNKEKYVDYAPTTCMLIHKSVFEKVGYIDETVFMYFDDTDFCVRLGKNNIRILYVPTAKMWHKVSSSTGGENSKTSMYYIARNQLYYINKYRENVSFASKVYIYIRALSKACLAPFRKKHKNDVWIFEAYKDYFHGKMGRKEF